VERIKAIFDECFDLMTAKNHDYAGEQARDLFANLRECERFGVPLHLGIMTRMSDKWCRACNLLQQDAAVKTESLEDTVRDMINYGAFMLLALRELKTQEGPVEIVHGDQQTGSGDR